VRGAAALALAVALAPLSAAAAPRTSLPLADGWRFRQATRADWYPAQVPGSVHLDLLRNGLIGDPFYRENEKSEQWIGKTDWEYAADFEVPAALLARQNVELVFEGLDTYATVTLNGSEVLRADNMYRRWRVPVKALLREGRNHLLVAFRSPIREVLPRMEREGYALPAVNDQGEGTSPYTRKAPYQYGWDWGPRLVTCGLWKPARLEAWDDARIADVFVRQQELGAARAQLSAEVELQGSAGASGTLTLELDVDGRRVASRDVSLREGRFAETLAFEIHDPKLWWPNGLGDQPLYRVTTRLLRGGTALDERSHRVGLRTLELRREQDRYGKSFEFVVNGVPVFVKGANWIPADSFPTRVTRERYAELLRSARDAHMNMLRVWGGGLYESDDFYELADELGLLLWQDFHFSCSMYPADPPFLANVEVEVEQAVRRLRNHPSLALWCGNNEIEAAWQGWGWKERLPAWLWSDYQKLFAELIPKVLAKEDPTRSYWPSSPSANGEAPPGSPDTGDMHFWGVWHGGLPFSDYEKQEPRFMSEYGFQSFPELATVESFATDADLSLESPVMLAHQRNNRGNQLIREYMQREFPPPKDFPAFLYLSQVLQAEGIKIGAEHLRRERPRTMGSLYWQLDDCWPVASWSSIDYYGRWKALQYYARRFYADVLVSTEVEDGRLGFWVVSDLRQAAPATLVARLLGFSGQVLWEKRLELKLAPLASQRAFEIAEDELLKGHGRRSVFLDLELLSDGRSLSENRRLFAPVKELALPHAAIKPAVRREGGAFVVTLSSAAFAPDVHLSAPGEGRFSDDYFDLVPGRSVTVRYTPKSPLQLAAFEQGLSVVSLQDAFAPTAPAR
jgi:beta-mannosidase